MHRKDRVDVAITGLRRPYAVGMTGTRKPERVTTASARWFPPLMAVAGFTMSLTAPLEVLYAKELG